MNSNSEPPSDESPEMPQVGPEPEGDEFSDLLREPLSDAALEFDPPLRDVGPLSPDAPELNLAGQVWTDEEAGDAELPGDTPDGAAVPVVVWQAPNDTWLDIADAPADVPEGNIAGPHGADLVPAGFGGAGPVAVRSSHTRRSLPRPARLGLLAAVGAAALFFGLRAIGSQDGDQAAPDAAAGSQATVTLPVSPSTTLPVTTTPAVTSPPTTTFTSTTAPSTTVPPTTTTPTTSAPTTTQAPRPTTTSPPTTAAPVRTTTPAPTTYGPFCGFVPGSIIAIDINGVPAGTKIADPDGCVSGTITGTQ